MTAGTHYLTCPSLRLPPGYLLTPDPAPRCLCGSCRTDRFVYWPSAIRLSLAECPGCQRRGPAGREIAPLNGRRGDAWQDLALDGFGEGSYHGVTGAVRGSATQAFQSPGIPAPDSSTDTPTCSDAAPPPELS
jgi:hypothetical protein